jgi:hypothetical protein
MPPTWYFAQVVAILIAVFEPKAANQFAANRISTQNATDLESQAKLVTRDYTTDRQDLNEKRFPARVHTS